MNYETRIDYDRETHDYAMRLRDARPDAEWELVGYARNYHEAEVTLTQLVFELESGAYFREAA